jgi:hypothetical protein
VALNDPKTNKIKKIISMEDLKAKQQVVEKIKSSANILVTVSDNPTVDALSAAIGLTLLFEKLGKYGTAIFSGVTPPAIAFLEPQKTLDNTTDSLRDFIIALDKEKADHLRYKVEGDAVKIFITPYKTTITSEDLQFSQGDYNVELVIALGVDDQDHLDKALEAHGQIFHDAAVITITANDQTSKLGGIDWHDDKASSLSEMITGLAESLKTDKNKSLIDSQIATAFLTGLVAQTERFSNRYTSPQSLNVASTLMASGADQQLIATKLQEAVEVVEEEAPEEPVVEETPEETKDTVEEDGTLRIIDHNAKKEEAPEPTPKEEFVVTHEANETLEEMDQRVKSEEQKEAAAAAYDVLNHIETPSDPRDSIEQEIEASSQAAEEPVSEEAPVEEKPAEEPAKLEVPATDDFIDDAPKVVTPRDPITENPSDVVLPPPIMPATEEMEDAPSMGGTLSATAELAADDKRREEESDRNKTILSHGNGEQEAAAAASVPQIDTQAPTLMPPTPLDLGLPLPPPLPDFSTQPSATVGPYAAQPAPQPEILGDILAPEPQTANSPYFTPPAATSAPNYFPPAAPVQPQVPQAPAPVSNDPGQFKIPGQQ